MPVPRLVGMTLLALCVTTPLGAQAASRPSCGANLDSLFRRIEENYAGYRLEVIGARRDGYAKVKAQFSREAARADGARCFPVLARLTAWFADPHLFVFQAERLDSAETVRRMEVVDRYPLDEAAFRADLARRAGRADPVEGIWYDRNLRLAIVREPGKGKDRFLAVVLTSDTVTWLPGDVRARLKRTGTGYYDVDLSLRDHARRRLNGSLHRRVLLRLSPGIWGKEYPVLPADSGSLDPQDAHRATWRSRGESAVLAIPSHDPTYASALQAIGRAHGSELGSLRFLIIDLRGNEGGSSGVTAPLLPYLRSATRRSTPYDADSAVMLSSPSQIAYARRAFGPDTSAFVRSLVARLEAAPGELVPLRDPAAPAAPDSPREVADGPVRVAVLVDGGTVSAAEVLVLEALRSTRALVIGQPTAGALDYQSVNVIRLSPEEDRWFLGYPTIARHAGLLPDEGMRGRGIAPDVVVDWSRVADPLAVVEGILRKE